MPLVALGSILAGGPGMALEKAPRENPYGKLSKGRVPFRVLFIRVQYYAGDPKQDPNLEIYPKGKLGKWGA